MAKMVTWLGEGDDGPSAHTWGGHRFQVGEPVKVTDEYVISKTGDPRYWKQTACSDDKPEPAEDKAKREEAKTKAVEEFEAQSKADREEAAAVKFKDKMAAEQAAKRIEDNKKQAAVVAQQKAAMSKQRQPTSTNDDGPYREDN